MTTRIATSMIAAMLAATGAMAGCSTAETGPKPTPPTSQEPTSPVGDPGPDGQAQNQSSTEGTSSDADGSYCPAGISLSGEAVTSIR